MSDTRDFQPSHLRDMNRKKVFRLMAERRELSKGEIARELGTSIQTITKITDFLLEKGYIQSLGEMEIPKGRRPQMYGFCPDSAYVLTAVFEGSYIKLCAVNLDGETRDVKQFKKRGDLSNVLIDQIGTAAAEYLEKNTARPILGLGIGLPGVVDSENSRISLAPYIGVNETTDLIGYLKQIEEKTGLDVFIENDVNVSALGVYAPQKMHIGDLVFLSLGTGFGAGLILDKKLRRGERSQAGEVGYLKMQNQEERLEEVIGLQGLKKRWGFAPGVAVARMKRQTYQQMLEELADVLASCVIHYAVLLDISNFVLGGITIRTLGDDLLEKIRQKTEQEIPFSIQISAEEGQHPGAAGMGQIVLEKKMNQMMSSEQ